MSLPVRSKKMAVLRQSSARSAAAGHLVQKWSASASWQSGFSVRQTRGPGRIGRPRRLLVARSACARTAAPTRPQRLTLQARPKPPSPAPGRAGHAGLVAPGQAARCSASSRAQLDIAFQNDLPVPAVLELARHRRRSRRPSRCPRSRRSRRAPRRPSPLRCAVPGPSLCDLRLLGDGQARPSRPLALVVEESAPPTVDRDEVLLIEDWRLDADGTAVTPGSWSRQDAWSDLPIPSTASSAPDISSAQPAAPQASLHQWLPTRRHCGQNRRSRGPGDGAGRRAGRALFCPQQRGGAGAGRPGRRP